MAQVRHQDLEELEDISEVTHKECRICRGKDKLAIFWNGSINEYNEKNFYICEDCYNIIKGIYIDTLL